MRRVLRQLVSIAVLSLIGGNVAPLVHPAVRQALEQKFAR